MNRYLSILLAVALVLGLGTNSWAGAPTDQLRTYTDQILKVLESPGLSLPEKRAAVRKIASEVFDTMERQAPHCELRFAPEGEGDQEALGEGRIDLSVWPITSVTELSALATDVRIRSRTVSLSPIT